MATLQEWYGRLSGVQRATATETLAAPLRTTGSGAAAFLGLSGHGDFFWIKVPSNPQGAQILVNERVVSELGRAVGAPVAATALIEVADDFEGWSYRDGYRLSRCIAHGSRHIEGAVVADTFRHARADNNPVRIPAVVALWDWCMGSDPQWIYDRAEDYSLHSFDHGFWICDEAEWDQATLIRTVDTPWSMTSLPRGLDSAAMRSVANRVLDVSEGEILAALAAVPLEWNVPDVELETLGWFLDQRREGVAERMHQMADRVDRRSRG